MLTFNRPHSLRRLLVSLLAADYLGDRVHINVWVDRPDGQEPHAATLAVAREFETKSAAWAAGALTVHVRCQNVGLAAQWHETWGLSLEAEGATLQETTTERAVILEDDLEVSPYFWRWLKGCHAAYDARPDFAGCTLARAALCAAGCADLQGGPKNGTATFLYPLVGSWGYSPSARSWMRFTQWQKQFAASGKKPYVPGLTPSSWYKSFEAQGRCPGKRCMWTMHHIRFSNEFKQLTAYIRLPGEETLSSNWREPGLHYDAKAQGPDFKLLSKWRDEFGIFPKEPTVIGWDGKVRRSYAHPPVAV